VFRERNESGTMFCQDAETLECHHDVARPTIQCVDHNDLNPSCLYIVEEPLEGRAFGDLFPPGAALVVFIKDRGRKPPPCALVADRSLLRINAKVIPLHPTGTTYIASHDDRRLLRWMIKLLVHGTPLELSEERRSRILCGGLALANSDTKCAPAARRTPQFRGIRTQHCNYRLALLTPLLKQSSLDDDKRFFAFVPLDEKTLWFLSVGRNQTCKPANLQGHRHAPGS